ncbi:hypothetical protein RFZ33_05240, partial [Acinetobacter baumannii]|nr:hypothetical protein [Acinetobacter baumannii]
MKQVDVAVREAKEKDMEVWIYDEDKWPSGCAGGLVSHTNLREYSAKGLTMELMSSEEIEKAVKKGRAFDTGKEY